MATVHSGGVLASWVLRATRLRCHAETVYPITTAWQAWVITLVQLAVRTTEQAYTLPVVQVSATKCSAYKGAGWSCGA